MRGSSLRAERPEPGRRRHLEPVRSHDDPQHGRDAESNAPAGGRVLVVDDEPAVRLLCRINLQFAGFEVVEAENGTEGLEAALREDFDLILLDVMMPDVGGHDVLRALRDVERTRDVPVLFLSARAGRTDLRTAYEIGAAGYVTKPFDPIKLGELVAQTVERSRTGESETYRRARLAELYDDSSE